MLLNFIKILICIILVSIASLTSNIINVTHTWYNNGNTGTEVSKLSTNATASNGLPWLVIHIGPTKTASTTLQYLPSQPRLAKTLEKDNFYFLGKKILKEKVSNSTFDTLFGTCGFTASVETCAPVIDKLKQELEYHHEQGQSVFISDELLTNMFAHQTEAGVLLQRFIGGLTANPPPNQPSKMMNSTSNYREQIRWYENDNGEDSIVKNNKKKWNVRIIVSYRRFFSRFVSMYSQMSGLSFRKYKEGQPLQTFPDFYRKAHMKHFKIWSRLLFNLRNNVDDVRVFNMHEEDEMIQHHSLSWRETPKYNNLPQRFYCQMIPEATNFCKILAKKRNDVVRNYASRKKEILTATKVMEEVEHRNWMDRGPAAEKLDREIMAKLKRKIARLQLDPNYPSEFEFTYDCLTHNETAQFWELSLKMERNTLPDFFFSPAGKPKLKEGFAAAKDKHSFCSVEVDTIVDQYELEILKALEDLELAR